MEAAFNAARRSDDLGDDPADVGVCGMSHLPFEREIGDVRIINVGSVGEAPVGGGEDVAHATWIESSPMGISVKQVRVPYEAE